MKLNKKQKIVILIGLGLMFFVSIFPPKHFPANQNGVECSIKTNRIPTLNQMAKIPAPAGVAYINYNTLVWDWCIITIATGFFALAFHKTI